MKVQLSDHFSDPELFELVETDQVHVHSRTCWKHNKNECRFSCGRYFTEKNIIVKPLDLELSSGEKKKEVLTWRNTLPKKVKSSIDNNLNTAKENVRTLSILNDDNFELNLKKQPNSRFVKNYFNVGLKTWNRNMDKLFLLSIWQRNFCVCISQNLKINFHKLCK